MTPRISVGQSVDLGRKLRRIRTRRGLTLKNVASMSGLSESFLSQLERGLVNGSIGSLRRICDALGIRVADLFEPVPGVVQRFVPASQCPRLGFGVEATKFLLASSHTSAFEAFLVEFGVGGSTGEEPYVHADREELIVLIRGSVIVQLDQESYMLEEEGSSVWFLSTVPHQVANVAPGLSVILWVIAPAAY